jgi:hypothetical protein
MANKRAYKPAKRRSDPSRVHEPPGVIWVQNCDWHRKRLYLNRADAKKVARLHRPAKNVYRCAQHPQLWHVGSLAAAVKAGEVDRRDLYGAAA